MQSISSSLHAALPVAASVTATQAWVNLLASDKGYLEQSTVASASFITEVHNFSSMHPTEFAAGFLMHPYCAFFSGETGYFLHS